MSNDLTQISVMVPENSKEEWKDTAEQSEEYNSMSQLIRTAVGKEVSGKYDSGGLERGDLQEVLDDRVVEEIDRVQQILNVVQGKVSNIEEHTERQAQFGRYTRIEMYSAIPKGKENALTPVEVAERLSDAFTPTDISVIVEQYDDIHIDTSEEPEKIYREE